MGLLRFWLALIVVFSHSSFIPGFRILPAAHAVGVFFVLAGFLASHVMEAKYRDNYRVFYLNRAIRLWPLYWLVWAASAGLLVLSFVLSHRAQGPMVHWLNVTRFPSRPWMTLFAFTQAFCVGQDLSAFGNVTREGVIAWSVCMPTAGSFVGLFFLNVVPQAWTLAVEEYFYAAAPLLKRLTMGWSGAIFVAGLALSSVVIPCEHLATGFYPPTLPFFLGGIFSYRLYSRFQEDGAPRMRLHQVAGFGYLLFIVFAGLAPFPVPRALTVGLAALALPSLFILFKDKDWDRYLGDLSYPIYLVHLLVLWTIEFLMPEQRALLVPFTILAAVLMAHTVERPLRRFRDRLLAREQAGS